MIEFVVFNEQSLKVKVEQIKHCAFSGKISVSNWSKSLKIKN